MSVKCQSVSIIVAVAQNRVIGRDGKIPWKLKTDLLRFKSLTMGHTVIMGRRTFESIGKPLNGRTNIVVSTTMTDEARTSEMLTDTKLIIARSLNEALEIAEKLESRTGTPSQLHGSSGAARPEHAVQKEIFVIGGERLYRDVIRMGIANTMYLTTVHAEVEGDTFFPEFSFEGWICVEEIDDDISLTNQHPTTFRVWKREKA